MAIIRVSKSPNQFSIIDRTPAEDPRLSFKAKGIMFYLLTKPDNWTLQVADLVKNSADGRDSVYSGLNELKAAGYITVVKVRGNNGKFTDYEYIVHENPVSPLTENPDAVKNEDIQALSPLTENPDTVKPDTEKPEVSNNNINDNYLNGWMGAANAALDSSILDVIYNESKKYNLYGTNLCDQHMADIYTMLKTQFPNQLDKELIRTAFEFFVSSFVKENNKKPGYQIKNPVGWFNTQYIKAIEHHKATKYRKKRDGVTHI